MKREFTVSMHRNLQPGKQSGKQRILVVCLQAKLQAPVKWIKFD